MTSHRSRPDSQLVPVLERHGITWEAFSKKGRPPRGVREIRSAIVTELHVSGLSWQEMMDVTGLSLGGIQRLTKGVGCPAARLKQKEMGERLAAGQRGKPRPWVSETMRQAWANGKFDFHRGRVRPEDERKRVADAHPTPEFRRNHSEMQRRLWRDAEHRARMVAFHRSEEQRRARSEAQSRRMLEQPEKWTRGRGGYVEVTKCTRPLIWTRSSFERAAVGLLETDPLVWRYEFEPRFEIEGGRWIIPDLLVEYVEEPRLLIEVKARWVLDLAADDWRRRRLRLAQTFAQSRGWQFAIWTEEVLFGTTRAAE